MPTYLYECKDCEHHYEEFRNIKDRDKDKVCHKCGSKNINRLPTGADHILKGIGWSKDGYRSKS